MLTALVCLATLNAPIDFECRATSLASALSALSEKTGKPMMAAGPVGNQIVFIKVTDVPLDDLKEKIAEAVVGTWEKKDDKEVIQRLSSQQAKIIAEQVAKRRALFEAEKKKYRAELEKPFDPKALLEGLNSLGTRPDDDYDRLYEASFDGRYDKVNAQSPVSRLIKRLFLATSTEDLARVRPFEHALFAAHPRKMQHGFDRKLYEVATSAFEREQRAWSALMQGVEFSESNMAHGANDPRGCTSIPPSGGDITLIYKRHGADQEGTVEVSHSTYSEGPWGTHVGRSYRSSLDRIMKGPIRANDHALALSPVSKLFLQSPQRVREGLELAPEIEDSLISPDKWDPLNFVVADVLGQYADVQKVDLVACIPDSVHPWVFSLGAGQARLGSFLRSLEEAGTMEVRTEGEWALALPIHRADDEYAFTGRKALGELMRSVKKSGSIGIDAFCDFARNSGRIAPEGIGANLIWMLDPVGWSDVRSWPWTASRLYGSLSKDQKNSLKEGNSITLRSLTAEQRALADHMVFREYRPIGAVFLNEGKYQPVVSALLHPDGLPSETTISFEAATEKSIFAYRKSSNGKFRPRQAMHPANVIHWETNIIGDPAVEKAAGVTNHAGYAYAVANDFKIRLNTSPTGAYVFSMRGHTFDQNAKPDSWEKLDPKDANMIGQAVRDIKRQKAERTKGSPPPR